MDTQVMRLSDLGRTRGPAVPAAFERLFNTEYARVVRIADRVLVDRHEAEDVAQEVFVSYYRSHSAGAPYAAPWLHAAAAHTALNTLRGRKRRVARETVDAQLRVGDQVSDPELDAVAAERQAEVREALGRIPAKSAAVLALRYSGLSYAEVAAALGIGINQVGTLLRRAEEAFKKEVAGDE